MLIISSQKALFVPKIFKFSSCLFDHVGKQLDKKAEDGFGNLSPHRLENK